MTYTYRNNGPEWTRSSGEVVPRGATFEATEREHARFQRRNRESFELVNDSPKVEQQQTKGSNTQGTAKWPLKMAPETYIKLHPKGKNADLARKILKERN